MGYRECRAYRVQGSSGKAWDMGLEYRSYRVSGIGFRI